MPVFGQLLVLFMMMIVGYVIKKTKIISTHFDRDLAVLLINVSLPALIICSLQIPYSPEYLHQAGQLLLISFGVYAISWVIALLLPRLLRFKSSDIGVVGFALMFSNVAFMGFPVIEATFGKEALFFVSFYNIPFNLLAFSVGIFLITRKTSKKKKISYKALFNIVTLSVIVAALLYIFQITLPQLLIQPLQLLGETTTPLSMVVTGSLLANISAKEIFGDTRVYLVTLFRILIIPLFFWIILSFWITQKSSLLLGIPVIISAMPAAANTVLLATQYNANPELASKLVFISTLLSLLSIPLMAMLF